MAEKPDKVDKVVEKKDDEDIRFRRQAAVAILGAFVQRHGGFEPAAMSVHMQRVWEYADHFVKLENAGPVKQQEVIPLGEQELPKGRPAHPSDEWAVIDGEKRKGGFVTREEAEFYASARPGARVKMISGPGLSNTTAVA